MNSESVASANEKAEQNIVMENVMEISVKGEAREAPKRRKVDPAPTESVKSQLEQKKSSNLVDLASSSRGRKMVVLSKSINKDFSTKHPSKVPVHKRTGDTALTSSRKCKVPLERKQKRASCEAREIDRSLIVKTLNEPIGYGIVFLRSTAAFKSL